MNTTTPRVFIAATRQNEGKTTVSLGLIAALQPHFPLIGYIKPVGQRFVEIEEQKIDEDIVLMDAVYQLNCPLVDMSPIAVEPAFTRKYLESANNESLVKRIQGAFDRVAWEKDFVLCEGSGHAGVGSVFDLSNAQVAKTLGCKVIIVSSDGYHNLTAVAYEGSDVRTETQVTVPVQIQNSSLSATLTLLDLTNPAPVQGIYHIRVAANTNTVSLITLYSTGGALGAVTNQSTATFQVAGTNLWAGLHPFYAKVKTSDGLEYRTGTQWVQLVSTP